MNYVLYDTSVKITDMHVAIFRASILFLNSFFPDPCSSLDLYFFLMFVMKVSLFTQYSAALLSLDLHREY